MRRWHHLGIVWEGRTEGLAWSYDEALATGCRGGSRAGSEGADSRPANLEERVLASTAKLVDFGNACWVHKQFTSDIQTRQYRCPEVRHSPALLQAWWPLRDHVTIPLNDSKAF